MGCRGAALQMSSMAHEDLHAKRADWISELHLEGGL